MRVLDIVEGTIVDGEGLRTSIYFAGCPHHCRGCHNPQSWNYEGGNEMSIEEILTIIESNGFNVTFSGGDPLTQPDIGELARKVKEKGYTIWCYTGYTYEDIKESHKDILKYIDVLVDGRYMEELKDTSLQFRGSSNQRIIRLA